jgi:RNA polymerase sigma factor (TIGR02999 family)
MSDATRLIEAAASGDRKAAADLLPLVYDELRKLATARLAAERPGHSLDPTALVHEAYLRLIGDQHFDGRSHFFAAAAEAMRRILVNHARDRHRQNRPRPSGQGPGQPVSAGTARGVPGKSMICDHACGRLDGDLHGRESSGPPGGPR